MAALVSFFDAPHAALMASVIAFVAFFLIARVGNARQGVAFAFGFTPLLAFFAIRTAEALL